MWINVQNMSKIWSFYDLACGHRRRMMPDTNDNDIHDCVGPLAFKPNVPTKDVKRRLFMLLNLFGI